MESSMAFDGRDSRPAVPTQNLYNLADWTGTARRAHCSRIVGTSNSARLEYEFAFTLNSSNVALCNSR